MYLGKIELFGVLVNISQLFPKEGMNSHNPYLIKNMYLSRLGINIKNIVFSIIITTCWKCL